MDNVNSAAWRFVNCQSEPMQVLEYLDREAEIMANDHRKNIARRLRGCRAMLGRWIDGRRLSLDEITVPVVNSFDAWMNLRGLCKNSRSLYQRTLRAAYARAVSLGLVEDRRPWEKTFTGNEETRKRAWGVEDLQRLFRVHLEGFYEFARDMFKMSFYLRGASASDMAALRRDDIHKGVLSYRRRKTGQAIMIGWTPEMEAICQRWPAPLSDDMLLPLTSRRGNSKAIIHKINEHLRALGEELGVSEPLTLYVARHSWATIARGEGLPLAVISQGLGHANENTTRIYLDHIGLGIINEANMAVIRRVNERGEQDE